MSRSKKNFAIFSRKLIGKEWVFVEQKAAFPRNSAEDLMEKK